ncbi:MAG TPA: ABC transporter ATP-binding protein [Flexilinea sp.]|jgi:ABC-type Fe3+/spermidine/putrescine transport system ATPase subunit|nr:ABC transporter ATP-binding protein [Flexilinea sp.]HPJ64962.1 ABC transporter ATP-binding protein [Flexilinea sp.]HPR70715.1 ABC transporter ATP-binding protein [Flexilinea sp.]HQF79275.1 ABC transporter ATP-binding protein [Flexilinea sp.]HQG88008.1 ABC transporter ATP-binding protein [Flexilinea sp.]
MLQLKDISYQYEKTPLLENLNLHLADHEILCLLGKSGSGKSTLLRIIAGLEKPDHGDIFWNGVSILNVPPFKRNFGLMFQDYALFPHLTVFENIAFGLEMNKVNSEKIPPIVEKLLKQVGMESFANRKVTELSGGEQQRVALARALAPQPHLLMLDEPLGALDHTLRVSLLAELRRILGENGIPSVYVTHDQDEAFSIADRIALLHDGVIVQTDTPENIFLRPKSVWVARFLGLNNLLPATGVTDSQILLKLNDRTIYLTIPLEYPLVEGQKIWILFRDEKLQLTNDADFSIKGIIKESIFKGSNYETHVEIAPGTVFSVINEKKFQAGTEIELFYSPEDLLALLI